MRCQCGYKLVNGRCPIPCNGRPLSDLPNAAASACHVVATPAVARMVYWVPVKPNEART